VIDLHTHTTASDGHLAPADLIREAWTAGVRVLAVTDHDTVAGIAEARGVAAEFGLTHVSGIEMTAVEDGRDVHVLGYFFDPDVPALARCLSQQREARRVRVRAMGRRLADAGVPVDVERLLAEAPAGRAVGRPALAAALVAAGHARAMHEAFDRWLAEGRPGWVAREGPTLRDVVDLLHAASGIASLAHPVLYGRDGEIPRWREAGLDALEVWHSEHSSTTSERYLALARKLDLLATGGSDFHGEPPAGPVRRCPRLLGRVELPEREFTRLRALVNHRGTEVAETRGDQR
jgi:predicted metal-dependent phosphoesterase TrpH